ncbi:histidinol-phosphatase HisJ family protein [Candidatus Formimonas warabiya]|uniref:Histidinol-phosphatase n=1 Tax=Formimonas warabiya TaxID=1761012 RepID=A0A3G1KRU6_FORW1|nr:histidinol-phosphatase HisJ family protein [Candidatus Formimonas warabiya]ATW25189.1 hypothetical protein DCMF_10770 [Candidatus Formimonas warabiya]
MLFSDNHVHTNFSPDSNAPMESVIKGAITKGLKELVLTDHVDFDYPSDPNPFLVDYDKYLVSFNQLKAKYQEEIALRLGVEIGAQPHVLDQVTHLLKKYPFDFVILSTHSVAGINCSDPEFFAQSVPKAAYIKYLEGLLSNVRHFSDYDVCGHLDFVARYNPHSPKKLAYQEYADIVDAILKTIIQSGHGIELNTAGYRYGLNQTHPSLEILTRYRELGGEIITVGSDAHKPEDIGAQFALAYDMLRTAGFNHITQFNQRRPFFIKLDHFQRNFPVTA